MQSLISIYQNTLITKSTLDDEIIAYSSLAIDYQVRSLVSKEIVRLEMEILSEIDNRVSSKEGIGRQHPIAFWVCLWTLILSYKDYRIWLCLMASDGKYRVIHMCSDGIVEFLLIYFKSNRVMNSQSTYITL
jgi:hypothetical protein